LREHAALPGHERVEAKAGEPLTEPDGEPSASLQRLQLPLQRTIRDAASRSPSFLIDHFNVRTWRFHTANCPFYSGHSSYRFNHWRSEESAGCSTRCLYRFRDCFCGAKHPIKTFEVCPSAVHGRLCVIGRGPQIGNERERLLSHIAYFTAQRS
jgi:hypothetical protein